jgi:hypothetical protein
MLPRTAEVYTYPPDARTPNATNARDNCLCRFRGPGLPCEQRNNRGQVALVQLENYPDLRARYGGPSIPLGMCSVMDRGKPWIVCPNRLFYTGQAAPRLEHSIYHSWGFKPGDQVALWRDVRIQSKNRTKNFNYRFDYVFRKVLDAGKGQYEDIPYVVEVMSCSTSGEGVSDDFAWALGSAHSKTGGRGPSLNKRHVLGRMMSQLFAMAGVVHEWGGKIVWIVQDVFWDYINETTGFNMDEFRSDPNGNMLLVVRHLEMKGYDSRDPRSDSYELRLDRILRGWDRFERSQGQNRVGRDFISIWKAPFTPPKELVLYKTNERAPTAVVACAT